MGVCGWFGSLGKLVCGLWFTVFGVLGLFSCDFVVRGCGKGGGKVVKKGLLFIRVSWDIHLELSTLSLREYASGRGQYEKWDRATSGVAVWSDRPHVLRSARRFGERDREHSSVFHFRGLAWRDELRSFARTLGSEDQMACCVADYAADGSWQPWTSVSLFEAVQRLESHWFPDLLERGGLLAHLQPIYCLRSWGVWGFEALARAERGERLVSGLELVEAAKAYSALAEFDVLARSAALVAGGRQLRSEERLFINIAPAVLEDLGRDLGATWESAREAGLAASRLVFEFVESERLPSPARLKRLVDAIRREGALVALDDFGAGHGSLGLIEQVRPDVVKFDRSLLPRDGSSEKERLLGGLVSYVHSVGALAIAEGVETLEQLAFAEDCGFDMVQGWLVGKPLAVAARPELSRAR